MITNLETPDDAAPIPNIPNTVSKWCFNDTLSNCNNEGGLYTWAEANALPHSCNINSCNVEVHNQGICPNGWHIPSDTEQHTLENYLTIPGESCLATRSSDDNAWGCSNSGEKLKYGGSSGFNAIGAGNHETVGVDSFFDKREPSSHIWSSSEQLLPNIVPDYAWNRALFSGMGDMVNRSNSLKAHGFSVRCLSDSILYFTDDFNDDNTDGWWLGYSLANPANNGNWRIENGELLQDTGFDGIIALVGNQQFSDQIVETKVKLNGPSGGGGIILWYQDDNNWTHAIVYPAGGFIEVSAHVNGTTFGFQYPYSSLVNDTWYDLKVVADSSNGILDIYLDGNYLFTHTMATSNRTGQTGVINGNAGGAFDDFRVTSN